MIVIGALALYSTAQAQAWKWLNPKPQGNALSGVYFINRDTGFCVGDVGTIMRTLDGGDTWDVKTCVTGSGLNAVCFPQRGVVGYAVGNSGTILKTTDAGGSWRWLQSDYPDAMLSVHFPVDAETGYAAGAGMVLKTSDGGEHWIKLPGTSSYYLTDIWFVGNDTGWATDLSGVLIKTTDGGRTWVDHFVTSEEMHSIRFPSGTKTGFIGGGNDVGSFTNPLYKSTDGGDTWVSLNDPQRAIKYGLSFPEDSLVGYAVGEFGVIVKTIDGGRTWRSLTIPDIVNTFYGVHFLNNSNGYLVGTDGIILKTTNGGANWTNLRKSLGATTDWYFSERGSGYVVGNSGLVLKSSDFGDHWDTTNIGFKNNLRTITFSKGETVGFTGGDSILLKTTNGGNTWEMIGSLPERTFSIYDIKVPTNSEWGYACGVEIYGDTGMIFKTTDEGVRWARQFVLPNAAVTKLSIPPGQDSIGYALGIGKSGLFKTTDSGNSWFQIYAPSRDLNDLQFPADPDTGYLASGFILLKTTNGGLTFLVVDSSEIEQRAISFPTNNRVGFAGGTLSTIQRTTDGGETWTRVCSGVSGEFGIDRIYFPFDTLIGFIGFQGGILRTLTGGTVSSVHDEPRNGQRFDFSLSQNFPNPFNPTTLIRYSIHDRQLVILKIYDILGQEIATLKDGMEEPGTKLVEFKAQGLSSGVYFYRLSTYGLSSRERETFTETKKLILMK